MPKTDYRSVDQYIAAQPASARSVLERVRAIVRKALPGAEETISYQIPAYCLHGRVAIYFAGWKEHFSLYPLGELVVAELGDELAPYEQSKGTIRFPLSRPVPAGLIGRIAKLRGKEVAALAEAKRAKSAQGRGTRGKTAAATPTRKTVAKRRTSAAAASAPRRGKRVSERTPARRVRG
jgi:uncharacterized protein YdhG (YjbR/CyaY superfamily)